MAPRSNGKGYLKLSLVSASIAIYPACGAEGEARRAARQRRQPDGCIAPQRRRRNRQVKPRQSRSGQQSPAYRKAQTQGRQGLKAGCRTTDDLSFRRNAG
jgi:hypothetical protein